MTTIRDIVISNTPPNSRYVAWAKPVGDVLQLHVFINGNWRTLSQSSITKATNELILLGLDNESYITPAGLNIIRNLIDTYIAEGTRAAINASLAYTDSLLKTYSDLNLYVLPSRIAIEKPEISGLVLSYNLTTLEELLFIRSYTLPNNSFVDANNRYELTIPFNSISSSRITHIRVVWKIRDIVIFDFKTILQNTTSEFDYQVGIINDLTEDEPYSIGDVASLEVYGYVSSGTDNIEVLFGDKDRTFSLVRLAPTATLAASKIQSILEGVPMNLLEINDLLIQKINALTP